MKRQRTFEWDEPIPMRQHGVQLSGLELLQRAIAGEYPPPPIAKLMDIRLAEIARGRAIFMGTPQ